MSEFDDIETVFDRPVPDLGPDYIANSGVFNEALYRQLDLNRLPDFDNYRQAILAGAEHVRDLNEKLRRPDGGFMRLVKLVNQYDPIFVPRIVMNQTTMAADIEMHTIENESDKMGGYYTKGISGPFYDFVNLAKVSRLSPEKFRPIIGYRVIVDPNPMAMHMDGPTLACSSMENAKLVFLEDTARLEHDAALSMLLDSDNSDYLASVLELDDLLTANMAVPGPYKNIALVGDFIDEKFTNDEHLITSQKETLLDIVKSRLLLGDNIVYKINAANVVCTSVNGGVNHIEERLAGVVNIRDVIYTSRQMYFRNQDNELDSMVDQSKSTIALAVEGRMNSGPTVLLVPISNIASLSEAMPYYSQTYGTI